MKYKTGSDATEAARLLGRLGGMAKSARKTAANRAKARAYWDRVFQLRQRGQARHAK